MSLIGLQKYDFRILQFKVTGYQLLRLQKENFIQLGLQTLGR